MPVVPSPEGSDLVDEYSLAFELQKELYERVKPKSPKRLVICVLTDCQPYLDG